MHLGAEALKSAINFRQERCINEMSLRADCRGYSLPFSVVNIQATGKTSAYFFVSLCLREISVRHEK